mgnify:FL=1
MPQQKTSSLRATGAAKRGSKKVSDPSRLTTKDLLALIEKHEAECSLRYERIEEKLAENSDAIEKMDKKIDKFDGRLWAIVLAVFLAPIFTVFLTKVMGGF